MRLLTREMPCRELVELVTGYLEGSLRRRDRRRFEAHIRGCEHCTTYVEQMRDELMAAFRGWNEGPAGS